MRLLQRSVRHFIGFAGLAVMALILGGCVTDQPPPLSPVSSDPVKLEMIPLQNGDSITVDLQPGTPTPPAPLQMTLNGPGNINLPLLETSIPAIGKSPHELEQLIHDLYVPKIYAHISVTVTPGPRYYYVSGEVIHPENGKQLYTGRATVLSAIYTCGGFNDFAARTKVQLTRQDGTILIEDCKKSLKNPKLLDLEVLPGDRIFVPKQSLKDVLRGK